MQEKQIPHRTEQGSSLRSFAVTSGWQKPPAGGLQHVIGSQSSFNPCRNLRIGSSGRCFRLVSWCLILSFQHRIPSVRYAGCRSLPALSLPRNRPSNSFKQRKPLRASPTTVLKGVSWHLGRATLIADHNFRLMQKTVPRNRGEIRAILFADSKTNQLFCQCVCGVLSRSHR